MLSTRRSCIGTYWPDFILATTLAETGGKADNNTTAWSGLVSGTWDKDMPPPVEVVTQVRAVSATDDVVPPLPARENVATEARASADGRTPSAVGSSRVAVRLHPG